MKYTILASGSRGNCTIISSKTHHIMVDCGIPKTELKEKLQELNIKKEDIEAIFVTHEHVDHIRSLDEFPNDIIYCTEGTYNANFDHFVEPYKEYMIAGFKVMPFPTSHDCKNPCGYIFTKDDEKMVYITDTGYVKEDDFPLLTNATHYIFESNYDNEMLMDSSRPFYLKQRIMSMEGHLSNESSANILSSIIGPSTKSVRLAHVSEDCNTHDKAYDALISTLDSVGVSYKGIDIVVADRYKITKGVG